ncbi:Transposable element Tc1 transposase, partial [Eumeta japonica]
MQKVLVRMSVPGRNVKRRLHFCKTHKNWTVDDWKRVIWSDETKVNRYQSDGKEYYWHRPQERIQKHHVKETMKHGGGSIMVWGCFSWWNIGPLVRIQGIMKKEDYLNILQTNLPEFVDESAYPTEEVVFQQDGDPKHTAKIVKSWLQNQNFGTMEWPAQSPDLNHMKTHQKMLTSFGREYNMNGELLTVISSKVGG